MKNKILSKCKQYLDRAEKLAEYLQAWVTIIEIEEDRSEIGLNALKLLWQDNCCELADWWRGKSKLDFSCLTLNTKQQRLTDLEYFLVATILCQNKCFNIEPPKFKTTFAYCWKIFCFQKQFNEKNQTLISLGRIIFGFAMDRLWRDAAARKPSPKKRFEKNVSQYYSK